MDPLTTDLAVRTFEADAAFCAALAELQAGEPAATIVGEARRAAMHGFAWITRPLTPGTVEVLLRHKGGAEESAKGTSATVLLAGLLGHPLAHDLAVIAAAQAAESEQGAITLVEAQAVSDPIALVEPTSSPAHAAKPERQFTQNGPEPAPSYATAALAHAQARAAVAAAPAEIAAESLAAATPGVVVAEVVAGPDPSTPLTDEQRELITKMVVDLEPAAQNAFKISFRSAFSVPREVKSIAKVITEHRHRAFCDNWFLEYFGGVTP